MKIKSITISGMHNITTPKTYNFKDINYLIGKNGAGKSTVLQAIQLAILGYIPGTDKRISEIFKHSSSKSMSVDLKLTNDDVVTETSKNDVQILRTWALKGRTVQSNVSTMPKDFEISTLVNEIELPIFNFNEFLNLSRNQLKSWFLDFLPKPDCKIDWKQEFTQTLLNAAFILSDNSYIDEVIEEVVESDEGLEAVQQTNSNLKELLSAKKIEVARLEGAVQALIFYDDISTEDYEESKAEILSQLDEIRTTRNKVADTLRILQSNKELEAKIEKQRSMQTPEWKIEEANQFVNESEPKNNELNQDCEALKDAMNKLSLSIVTARNEIASKKKIITGGGICPYTQTACDSITAYISTLADEIKDLEIKIAAYTEREQKHRSEFRDKSNELSSLQKEVAEAKSTLTTQQFLDAQIQEYQSQIKAVSPEDMELLNIPIAELDEQETNLQEKLSKLEGNHAYEEKIDEITSNKFKAENELEALKLFIKRTDANNMQTEIAQLPFAEFSNKMNDIVPELFGREVYFHINLESKANSFSFGIAKSPVNADEIYIPYDLMSSGEKTLLAFAIMSYIAKNSSSELKLVMIDDMLDHLDDANIKALFDKFSNENIQIINAGVKSVDNPEVNIIQI